MAWETRNGRGRYYTRSVKEGGRVRREYVGCGPAAELAALLDAREREEREQARDERRAEQEQWDAAERPLVELCELTDALARAALLAAGYRRHDRGEWRRRRGEAG